MDNPMSREFNFRHTDKELVGLVNEALTHAKNKDDVKTVFNAAISGLMEA
jgi:hypothetical protein